MIAGCSRRRAAHTIGLVRVATTRGPTGHDAVTSERPDANTKRWRRLVSMQEVAPRMQGKQQVARAARREFAIAPETARDASWRLRNNRRVKKPSRADGRFTATPTAWGTGLATIGARDEDTARTRRGESADSPYCSFMMPRRGHRAHVITCSARADDVGIQ